MVPFILVSGFAMSWVLTAGDSAVLRRPYGLLLGAKLGGFVLLLVLAAYNNWKLTPALSAGHTQASATLRNSIVAEYGLIVGVLVATATLTTLFSPEH